MGQSTYTVLTYNPEGTTTRRQRSTTTYTALTAALTHAWQQAEVCGGWHSVDATAQHLSGAQGWGCLLQTKRNSEEVRVIIGHPDWARGEDAENLADAVLATIGNMVATNTYSSV